MSEANAINASLNVNRLTIAILDLNCETGATPPLDEKSDRKVSICIRAGQLVTINHADFLSFANVGLGEGLLPSTNLIVQNGGIIG